jgi:hypothetical protein
MVGQWMPDILPPSGTMVVTRSSYVFTNETFVADCYQKTCTFPLKKMKARFIFRGYRGYRGYHEYDVSVDTCSTLSIGNVGLMVEHLHSLKRKC